MSVTAEAKRLGVSRQTIYNRMRKSKMDPLPEYNPRLAVMPDAMFWIGSPGDNADHVLFRWRGSENVLKMSYTAAERLATVLGLELTWNYWRDGKWEK